MLTIDSQSPKATSRARHQLPENQNRLSAVKSDTRGSKIDHGQNFTLICQNSTTTTGNPESNSKFQKVTPRVRWIPRGR